MKPLNILVFVISLSLVSVLCLSCKGGELVNPDRQWINAQNEQINTGELAGEIADELAGEIAGELTGEGAGEVIESLDCGLYSSSSIIDFSQTPLQALSSSCVGSGCHNANAFNMFKLNVSEPDNGLEFSPAQVESALNAVEPFVIVGDGPSSILSTRMLDDHSSLTFNDQSPEYLSVITWINEIPTCP